MDIPASVSSILKGLRCDFAELRIARGRSTGITLSGDQVDSIGTGESAGGSVRVLRNGAWGFASFTDIGAAERSIKRAAELADCAGCGRRTGIVPGKAVAAAARTASVRDIAAVSLDEKFELISAYNAILKKSNRVQTTRAVYSDVKSEYRYLNSEGSDCSYEKSFCGISLNAIARDGSVIQPFGESVAGYGGFEIVQNRQSEAERVAKTAVDLLSAEPVKGGTYPVIINPRLAGVFIHEAFGHLSEADFIYENPRMRDIMTIGRRFGDPSLAVIDDGTVPGLAGYIPFDDEGMAPQKTSLIRDGVLAGRLHSRETAYAMNETPSGNARAISTMSEPLVRMTNTYIENGIYDPAELFDAVEDGIYACDVIGGQTNLEMFTFSAAYGYAISRGKPGRMIRDIVLSGNVFTTLGSISKIANDRQMFGGLGGCGKKGQGPLPVSFGGPHMLVENVLIGGRQ